MTKKNGAISIFTSQEKKLLRLPYYTRHKFIRDIENKLSYNNLWYQNDFFRDNVWYIWKEVVVKKIIDQLFDKYIDELPDTRKNRKLYPEYFTLEK